MKASWFILPLALSAACGAPESEPWVTEVVLPWQGGLACAEKELVGERMQATLQIGGHQNCALSVDPDTLEASGTCPNITARTKWPLMLVYEQRELAGITLPVGYWIGVANLCDANLPTDGSADVAVSFADDNVNGTLIFDQEDIDDLPVGTSKSPTCSDTLNEAKIWAKGKIAETHGNLDYDCDAQSNIVEACNDTIFTEDLSLCN